MDCPKCQSSLSIPVSKVGKSIVCSKCKRSFNVPTFEELAGAKNQPIEPEELSSELSLSELDSSLFDNVDQLIEEHQKSTTRKELAAVTNDLDADIGEPDTEETEQAEAEAKPGLADYEEEFSLDAHLDSPELKLGSPPKPEPTNVLFPNATDELTEVEEEEEDEENLTNLVLDADETAFSETKSAEIYAVVCKICDSRIQVTMRNQGETIPCPECFTDLYLHGPSKADRERMEKAKQAEEYELAPAEPPPKPIADGHGLDMETRDLLSPPSKDPLGESSKSGEDLGASENAKQTPRAKTAGPDPASEKTNGAAKPKAKKKKKKKYGSKAYWEAKVAEADVGEKTPKILTQEKIGAVDYMTWVAKSLRSADLIARGLIGIVALGFTYWMGDIVQSAYAEGAGLSSSGKIIRGIIPILLGGGSLLVSLAMLTTSLGMVFQNSANGVSVQEDWPGFSPSDWFGPVAFFFFSLWLACIPGAFIGVLLSLVTGVSAFILLAGSFSAFIFAPPLYMCACFNGSPFNVFSKKVVKTFGTEEINWLTYTPLAFGAWLVFAAGVGIICVPNFLFAFAGAAVQVTGFLIYAAVIGLFCGRYVTRLL